MTDNNQYSISAPDKTVSMPNVLKNAGYSSLWLSNQNQFGVFGETEISALASNCTETVFLDKMRPVGLMDRKFDKRLLELIPTQIKPPFALFLHLFGSHVPYTFETTDANKNMNSYEKSLYYTDSFFSQLVPMLEQRGVDIIIYFSDHGEEPGIGHDFRNLRISMLKIPCWIWLSEKYAKKNPELCVKLSNSKNKIFTNDLIFNLIGGVLNAEGKAFAPQFNIFSPEYLLKTNADAKTLYGKITIEELYKKYR